jgi:hypothetical protein
VRGEPERPAAEGADAAVPALCVPHACWRACSGTCAERVRASARSPARVSVRQRGCLGSVPSSRLQHLVCRAVGGRAPPPHHATTNHTTFIPNNSGQRIPVALRPREPNGNSPGGLPRRSRVQRDAWQRPGPLPPAGRPALAAFFFFPLATVCLRPPFVCLHVGLFFGHTLARLNNAC